MCFGEGEKTSDPVKAIEESYEKGVTDEFIEPIVCAEDGQIKANDSVVFFNFRPDRAREITRTLVDSAFGGFERKNGFFPLTYVCMTQYDATMPGVLVAFKPQRLENTLGEYLSKLGKTQLRIAETERQGDCCFVRDRRPVFLCLRNERQRRHSCADYFVGLCFFRFAFENILKRKADEKAVLLHCSCPHRHFDFGNYRGRLNRYITIHTLSNGRVCFSLS